MADEMDGFSRVGALCELLRQLLHAVFSAAVHARRDRLTHCRRVVHLCCGAKQHLRRLASCRLRGLRHSFPDDSDILCNACHPYPTTFPLYKFFALTMTSSPGQRFAVEVRSSFTS